jgi:hypothetical protein
MAKTTGIGSLGPVKKGPVILATGPQGAQITTGNTTPTSGYTPAPIVGGTGKTPTQQTITLQPDYQNTQFITNAVHQKLLGMNATKQDVDEMHAKFLAYAKANPIQTSSTTYDSTGAPLRSIVSEKSPLSETDFITNIVNQTADAKEYNAGTTLFDAMRTAMGSFRGGY